MSESPTSAPTPARGAADIRVVVDGPLSVDEVRRVVALHRDRIHRCLPPPPRSYVTLVKFEITTTGLVQAVAIQGDASGAACLSAAAKKMHFARPPATVRVEYTID